MDRRIICAPGIFFIHTMPLAQYGELEICRLYGIDRAEYTRPKSAVMSPDGSNSNWMSPCPRGDPYVLLLRSYGGSSSRRRPSTAKPGAKVGLGHLTQRPGKLHSGATHHCCSRLFTQCGQRKMER